MSDVQAYFNFVNQPLNVPIVNVLLDGVSGICGAGCDDGEEVIDIQQAVSMAPGLSAVIVYEGSNDTDMFNQMAVDNVAKQLSCSFGFLPPDPQSDEPIFQEFAAQGQNLFVASGDGGAYFGDPVACANFSNLNGCVFYPADDPLITAAGGTNLTTNGPGGSWQSETGWIGSGGGFSTNGLAIPSYQAPVINGTNQGSTTLRNIPDVAAEANTDNLFCANGGCFIGVGGTSLSAPRWAGFLALAPPLASSTQRSIRSGKRRTTIRIFTTARAETISTAGARTFSLMWWDTIWSPAGAHRTVRTCLTLSGPHLQELILDSPLQQPR